MPEFTTLSNQLNKDMVQKDRDTAARKKRKFLRGTKDYQEETAFKWQSNIVTVPSTFSTPEREVKSNLELPL